MKTKLGNTWPLCVDKSQLELSYYKGSGAGGQARNKTSSGVQIKHIPTGLITRCDETRSQAKNKQIAFRKLAEKLIPFMKQEVEKQRYQAGTERIRTYHEPQQRVTDERLDKTFNYDVVLLQDGLEELLEDLIASERW